MIKPYNNYTGLLEKCVALRGQLGKLWPWRVCDQPLWPESYWAVVRKYKEVAKAALAARDNSPESREEAPKQA